MDVQHSDLTFYLVRKGSKLKIGILFTVIAFICRYLNSFTSIFTYWWWWWWGGVF